MCSGEHVQLKPNVLSLSVRFPVMDGKLERNIGKENGKGGVVWCGAPFAFISRLNPNNKIEIDFGWVAIL